MVSSTRTLGAQNTLAGIGQQPRCPGVLLRHTQSFQPGAAPQRAFSNDTLSNVLGKPTRMQALRSWGRELGPFAQEGLNWEMMLGLLPSCSRPNRTLCLVPAVLQLGGEGVRGMRERTPLAARDPGLLGSKEVPRMAPSLLLERALGVSQDPLWLWGTEAQRDQCVASPSSAYTAARGSPAKRILTVSPEARLLPSGNSGVLSQSSSSGWNLSGNLKVVPERG